MCLFCGVLVCAVVYLCECSGVCLFIVLRCYSLAWLCVGVLAQMAICLSVCLCACLCVCLIDWLVVLVCCVFVICAVMV